MHELNNVFWHALSGAQRQFSLGDTHARRFAPGFSPIVAFPDPERPDFAALRPYCAAGESFYCDGWTGEAPPGWRIELESSMYRMLWQAALPARDEAEGAQPLGPEHAAAALELARLTRPGPFGPRTLELGDYFGYFEDGRLIAMAGERVQAGRLREVSGVCTHPDFQGRGLARRLMTRLLRRELARGEVPFLHVMRGNAAAVAMYTRMGFGIERETPVRVVVCAGAADV